MKEAIRKAIKVAIMESGHTVTGTADAIGMKQSKFSRHLHSDASFTDEQFIAICQYIGKSTDYIYERAREFVRQEAAK